VPAEVRIYDRLFRVPFPGARNPWGTRGDGQAIEAPDAPIAPVVVAGDDDAVVETAERNYLDDLNPESKRTLQALVEPALVAALPEERFQFERHGYFVADLVDHAPGRAVFNRAVTLRDSWSKTPAG
jgi:glutaminyl-tRNA synthetase